MTNRTTTTHDSWNLGVPKDGWIANTAVWSYSSADSPTFVISINADMTGILQAGMRIKLTQTTAKYFIITAVGSFSGGNTLVTVYGGTDYTLANAAISNPYYSPVKAPFGFPMSPEKWTVSLTDTSNAAQATPTSGNFYNLGSLSIDIPIGVWRVYYSLTFRLEVTTTALRNVGLVTALSTNSGSVSDNEYRVSQGVLSPIGGAIKLLIMTRDKPLALASKTTYYLIGMGSVSTDAITSIAFRGDLNTTMVRAICAYL